MKKSRFFTLLLTVGLIFGVYAAPVWAAGSMGLELSGKSTSGLSMKLKGLPADCRGVQATITLDQQTATNFSFDSGLSAPGIHCTYLQEGNSLTVYAVSKHALGINGSLKLGVLSSGTEVAVASVSDVKVLNRTLSGSAVADSSVRITTASDVGGAIGDSSNPTVITPNKPAEGNGRFRDVAAGAWYCEAVTYVQEKGLMKGITADTFAPGQVTTRGQIATILYRLEGSPVATVSGGFTDVAAGAWYADAVNWAAAKGIVKGFEDGSFGAEKNITREQLAAMFYRYAEYRGADISVVGDLNSFFDGNAVSSWAANALRWANGSGLVTGKNGGYLDPQGKTTRAEVATMLMRYHKK